MGDLPERLMELFGDERIAAYVQGLALLLARVLPITTFSPLFGGPDTPAQLRLGLGAAIAVALSPLVSASVPPGEGALLMGLVAKELLIGGSVAVLLTLVFEMFGAAGSLIDVVRGASMAETLDPTSGQRISQLGVFFKLFFVTIFITAGGHRLLLEAFGEGLQRVPLDRPLGDVPGEFFGGGAAGAVAILAGELALLSIQLAMPVIAIVLLVDLSLGLLNRVAQQINAFFLGLTIKGTVGVLAVLISLAVATELFMERIPGLVRRLVSLA